MRLAIRSTDKRGANMVLCDADTGEVLPGQRILRVVTKPGQRTKAVVEFYIDKSGKFEGGVVVQIAQVVG